MAFKLKKKPTKPENPTETVEYALRGPIETFADVVTCITNDGLSFKDIVVDHDNGWGDETILNLYVKKPIYSDAKFAAMLADYEERLRIYNQWYKANQEQIEEALREKESLKKLRKEVAERKKLEALQKQREALEKQIQKITVGS